MPLRRPAVSTTLRLTTAGTLALIALGCGSDRTQGVMTADLERDLALASSAARPANQVVSALEGGPQHAPSGEQRGRRDNIVRPQRAPRVNPKASTTLEAPVTEQVAEAPAPVVEVANATPAPAPVPTPATDAPAPRPTWGVIYDEGQNTGRGPSDNTGTGSMGTGRGRDGGMGGIGGVIIRGGSAGEDHCEPRGGIGRRGRMPGGMGGMGGMGGGGIIGGVIGGVIGRGTFPRY
ncbi:MAG: hypothetical protein K2R93_01950 [Gemmatimonadaceae bacterium]|nr:hypothetical protein [Gemmatimonadaceae bacterium]